MLTRFLVTWYGAVQGDSGGGLVFVKGGTTTTTLPKRHLFDRAQQQQAVQRTQYRRLLTYWRMSVSLKIN
ncbi:hypothetical protein EVAR_76111_1 [Eumeta japonica]|uniref:Uncharacterized protein n=1 Tax=Eumeta variegata TaxID=151549 RepID=A0A4C1W478_EUMVA|nr:hypothetical protein EVAR_76111_1 [Eumeta japonica]